MDVWIKRFFWFALIVILSYWLILGHFLEFYLDFDWIFSIYFHFHTFYTYTCTHTQKYIHTYTYTFILDLAGFEPLTFKLPARHSICAYKTEKKSNVAARPRTVISRLLFSQGHIGTYKNFFAAVAVKEWRKSACFKVWCGSVVCGGRVYVWWACL